MHLLELHKAETSLYVISEPVLGYWGYGVGKTIFDSTLKLYVPFPYASKPEAYKNSLVYAAARQHDVFKSEHKTFYDYKVVQPNLPCVGPPKEHVSVFKHPHIPEVLDLLENIYSYSYVTQCATYSGGFYKSRLILSVFNVDDVYPPEIHVRSGVVAKLFDPGNRNDLATITFSDVAKMFNVDGFVLEEHQPIAKVKGIYKSLQDEPPKIKTKDAPLVNEYAQKYGTWKTPTTATGTYTTNTATTNWITITTTGATW